MSREWDHAETSNKDPLAQQLAPFEQAKSTYRDLVNAGNRVECLKRQLEEAEEHYQKAVIAYETARANINRLEKP